MFKRVESFCSLKRIRGFAPYGWTNVRPTSFDMR